MLMKIADMKNGTWNYFFQSKRYIESKVSPQAKIFERFRESKGWYGKEHSRIQPEFLIFSRFLLFKLHDLFAYQKSKWQPWNYSLLPFKV